MKTKSVVIFVVILTALAFSLASCTTTTPASTPPPAPTLNPSVTSPPTQATEPPKTLQAITAAAPSPSLSLSTTGPWFLFYNDSGLWAVNADGSGLTNVYRELYVIYNDPAISLSPKGGRFAFLTSTARFGEKNLTLRILNLANGSVDIVTPLTNKNTEPAPDAEIGDPAVEAVRAILVPTGFAWSPDGKQLAFIGAQGGTTADLYVYSIESKKITRLTDDPSQAYRPSWSPDGKYIVQMGAENFGRGDYVMAGVWAARADNSGVKSLYKPENGDEEIAGWTGNESFVVAVNNPKCGHSQLREVTIEQLSTAMKWQGCYYDAFVDPASKSFLINVGKSLIDFNEDKRYGAFYFASHANKGQLIAEGDFNLMRWSPEIKSFVVSNQQEVLIIAPDGKATRYKRTLDRWMEVSPNGTLWAWSDANRGLWVGAIDAPRQVFNRSIMRMAWNSDGNSLILLSEGSIYIARAPEFIPVKMVSGIDTTSARGLIRVQP